MDRSPLPTSAIDAEASYLRLKKFLFGVLAHLARHGFPVAPYDGADLIHDFIIDVWESLVRRFDPDKGSFEPYVFSAFLRYARPRIIRLNRWKSYLVASHEMAGPLEARSSSDAPITVEDSFASPENLRALEGAVRALPNEEQQLLHYYFSGSSQRELAARYAVSRYKLCETLTRVLARVATAIDEPGWTPTDDWIVAVALWRDGRTVAETATYLGRTTNQVRLAQNRILSRLRGKLRVTTPRRPMREMAMKTEALSLLASVLASKGAKHLLSQLASRADEILQKLEEGTDSPELTAAIEKCDPEWLTSVYEAIAGEERLSAEDQTSIRYLLEADRREDEAIGGAFSQALLPGLPPNLQEFVDLKSAPHVEERVVDYLRRHQDVVASKGSAERLLRYGLTPTRLYYAMDATAYFVLGHMKKRGLAAGRVDVKAQYKDDKELVPAGSLIGEVADYVECDLRTAEGTVKWLVGVAEYRSHIFPGLRAIPKAPGIVLERSEAIKDLYIRWSKSIE